MVHAFKKIHEFIDALPDKDAAEIFMDFDILERGATNELDIKQLRGKVKELIVCQYRIVFFRFEETVYVVDIFKKQSQKPLHALSSEQQRYIA